MVVSQLAPPSWGEEIFTAHLIFVDIVIPSSSGLFSRFAHLYAFDTLHTSLLSHPTFDYHHLFLNDATHESTWHAQ